MCNYLLHVQLFISCANIHFLSNYPHYIQLSSCVQLSTESQIICFMSNYTFGVQFSISSPIIHFVSNYPLQVQITTSFPITDFVCKYPFRVQFSISCPIIYFKSKINFLLNHFIFNNKFRVPFLVQLSKLYPIIHLVCNSPLHVLLSSSCSIIHFVSNYSFNVQLYGT